MSSDPRNPFSQPLPTPPPLPAGWQPQSGASSLPPLGAGPSSANNLPGALPSLASGGGMGSSLAQSARMKQLKSARTIMFLLGGLQLIFGLIIFGVSGTMAKSLVDEEVKKVQQQGMIVDQAKVAEVQQAQERGLKVTGAILLGIGALFITFGFIVK